MSFKLANCSWYEFEHNSSQIYRKLQDSEELRWFWWCNFLNVSLTFHLSQAGTLQLRSSGSTLRKHGVIGDLRVKWPVKSNDTWFSFAFQKCSNQQSRLCIRATAFLQPNSAKQSKKKISPRTHHQTPMTCKYGFSHFRHFKTVATEMEIQFLNTWIMFPSLLPQIWKYIFLF